MSLMSVRKRGTFRINSDEILFIIGKSSIIGVAKAGARNHIIIGTPDKDEIVIFLEQNDLIVVSGFIKGHAMEKGIKSLIYLIREIGSPLIVLPPDHPTSKQLPLVVAAGPTIHLDCNIIPGTHPEQYILCAGEDLSGMIIRSTTEGVEIEGSCQEIKKEML